MAKFVVTDEFKQFVLTYLTTNETIQMRLYTNTVTWSHATVITDLIEPTWLSYSPLTVSSWGSPSLDSNDEGIIQGTTIHGAFYWIISEFVLLGGGAFASPITLNPGDQFTIIPTLQSQSQF
jgi:hypothetical protein